MLNKIIRKKKKKNRKTIFFIVQNLSCEIWHRCLSQYQQLRKQNISNIRNTLNIGLSFSLFLRTVHQVDTNWLLRFTTFPVNKNRLKIYNPSSHFCEAQRLQKTELSPAAVLVLIKLGYLGYLRLSFFQYMGIASYICAYSSLFRCAYLRGSPLLTLSPCFFFFTPPFF